MLQRLPEPVVPSLWAATATPAQAFPPLDGETKADVAIIGGGYTGLSTALHAAADGLRPVVLDAYTLGWGASGRNGGVVSAKFRLSFADAAARHGMDVARRMYAMARESVDLVESLVDTLGIDAAAYRRVGQVKGAHTPAALAATLADMAWMRAEMGDGTVSSLSGEEVARVTGATGLVGGVLSPHAGAIHPLGFLRGLVRVAAQRGIALHEATPALRLRRDGAGVVVETPNGVVRAARVVLATNGYSDLTGATEPVRRRLVPFRSAMIATAPLDAERLAAVLPGGHVMVETRRMMRWCRIVDGRMLFGGRGAFGKRDSEAAFAVLRRAMVRSFPVLRDVPVDHRWSGLVAMTLDGLPHVGHLDERTLFAMGYNGAGVATSILMGKYLAALLRGEAPDLALLDGSRFAPIPFYPLRGLGVRAVAGWYQLLDAASR